MKAAFADVSAGDLAERLLVRVLRFCGELRKVGVPITTATILDALQALPLVDLSNRSEFYFALRAALIKKPDHLQVFDAVFRQYWHEKGATTPTQPTETKTAPETAPAQQGKALDELTADVMSSAGNLTVEPLGDEENYLGQPSVHFAQYSPVEILSRRNFENKPNVLRQIEEALLKHRAKLVYRLTRRMRLASHGAVDLRGTMRKSLQFGGEILNLRKRSPKPKSVRILLLCDVSGSMKHYSEFAFQFLYAMQNLLGNVETFIFGTRLTRITENLRGAGFDEVMRRFSGELLDWGGGTRIGSCLQSLTEKYTRLINRRSVVVIISDGWDTGDIELLEGQMRKLKKRCLGLIWVNPLLEDRNYEPACRGMVAALPFVDVFTYANDVKSLERLLVQIGQLIA